MLEYLKDWRTWLLGIVIILIVEFPVYGFGEKLNFEPVRNQSKSIQLKFHEVKFKWRLNKFDTKWQPSDSFNIRHKFTMDDVDEYRSVVLLTIEF